MATSIAVHQFLPGEGTMSASRLAIITSLAAVLCLCTTSAICSAESIRLRSEVVALPRSSTARATFIELYVDVDSPNPIFVSAHQVRVAIESNLVSPTIRSAGRSHSHPYVGPSSAPAVAVTPKQVDAGDISFSGSVKLESGAGLLRLEINIPADLHWGLYPLRIVGDPQFTFIANSQGQLLPVDLLLGGIRIASRDGDFDFNRTVDGNDFLEWQQQYGMLGLSAADADGSARVDTADLSTWRINYGFAARVGDYDLNNSIDGSDFLNWQRTFGSRASLAADGNENGIIDRDDMIVWKIGFDTTKGNRLRVIAEPHSSGIALWLMSVLPRGISRRARRQ